jgi:hypothetical protein
MPAMIARDARKKSVFVGILGVGRLLLGARFEAEYFPTLFLAPRRGVHTRFDFFGHFTLQLLL